MSDLDRSAESLAAVIRDYELLPTERSPYDHCLRWIEQFDPDARLTILREITHVLAKSYFSKHTYSVGLCSLLNDPFFGVYGSKEYWGRVSLLDIQQNGGSQRDVIEIAKAERLGDLSFGAGASETEFVYLDDFLFSGNRVVHDVKAWMSDREFPGDLRVDFAFLGCFSEGLRYAKNRLSEFRFDLMREKGVRVEFRWANPLHIYQNDKSEFAYICDVFRPSKEQLREGALMNYYDETRLRGFDPYFRSSDAESLLFSSSSARAVLELTFFSKGLELVSNCANPSAYLKPLGYDKLHTFGFGAPVVTYRNCPNNAPLVFWWGCKNGKKFGPLAQWYPLFPRKTYGAGIGFDDTPYGGSNGEVL